MDFVDPSQLSSVLLEQNQYELFLDVEHTLTQQGRESQRVTLITNVFKSAIRLDLKGIALHIGAQFEAILHQDAESIIQDLLKKMGDDDLN